MLIQINTDHNIQSADLPFQWVAAAVRESLEHFSDHITRVEVHLSDQNGDQKTGIDAMRCMLEARLASHQPIVVTHQATTLDQAVAGAAEKMKHAVESLLGRLATH
jgi:Holliday junction resolvasome RuvABC endonuclease subunit